MCMYRFVWCLCVPSLTGVLWFLWKSRHLAAYQSTRWAHPPRAEQPLPAARLTSLLLQQQHPRAWSTPQVRDSTLLKPSSHFTLIIPFPNRFLWIFLPSYILALHLFSVCLRRGSRQTTAVWRRCWKASSDSKAARWSGAGFLLFLQKLFDALLCCPLTARTN